MPSQRCKRTTSLDYTDDLLKSKLTSLKLTKQHGSQVTLAAARPLRAQGGKTSLPPVMPRRPKTVAVGVPTQLGGRKRRQQQANIR